MFEAVLLFLEPYSGNPAAFLFFLFGHGGGLIIIPMVFTFAWQGWMNYTQEKWRRSHDYRILRIEVPQLNEQSMKAVEQIFVHIYGALDVPSREEKYWLGFVLENFSFEIESNGGYITFYVHTPSHYKNMIEAAFYAQYPDALLTEVEDYSTQLTEDMIMNDKVRVWGAELKLANDDINPIRSWPNWEHQLAQRSVDPLASILEVMTRLKPGEHWWFQILAQPLEHTEFRARAQAAIDELVDPGSSDAGLGPVEQFVKWALGAAHNAVAPWTIEDEAEGSAAMLEKRKRLTTPEREWIEEVDRKMSRWPYMTKIRWMYWAPEDLYDEYKGRRGMYGALQQFRFINWFVEGHLTRVHQGVFVLKYLFPQIRLKWRARRMMWAYQSRFMNRGEHEGFVLNTEELASIFHFPQIEVRAPYITKAVARGVEPPTSLNFTDVFGSEGSGDTASVKVAGGNSEPTANIPTANVVPERDATRNPIVAAEAVINRAQTVLGEGGYNSAGVQPPSDANATVQFQSKAEAKPVSAAPAALESVMEGTERNQTVQPQVQPPVEQPTVHIASDQPPAVQPTQNDSASGPQSGPQSGPPSNLPFV